MTIRPTPVMAVTTIAMAIKRVAFIALRSPRRVEEASCDTRRQHQTVSDLNTHR